NVRVPRLTVSPAGRTRHSSPSAKRPSPSRLLPITFSLANTEVEMMEFISPQRHRGHGEGTGGESSSLRFAASLCDLCASVVKSLNRSPMKPALLLLFVIAPASAEPSRVWKLWETKPPGDFTAPGPETASEPKPTDKLPILRLTNISEPRLEFYEPAA